MAPLSEQDHAELIAWLERTTRKRGVPLKVEDPDVITALLALIAAIQPSR